MAADNKENWVFEAVAFRFGSVQSLQGFRLLGAISTIIVNKSDLIEN